MIPNLLLLTGKDDFRLRERLRFYRAGFVAKYPDGTIETFEADDGFAAMENAVLTPSLFASRRLVILEGFWTPEIFETAHNTKFFESLPDHETRVTLLCIEPSLDKRLTSSKFLLKHARTESFDPMEDERVMTQWMLGHAAQCGVSLSASCARHLLGRCGSETWLLATEIEKLGTAAGGQPITNEMIDSLTQENAGGTIWQLTEAMSRKDSKSAISALHEALDRGEAIYYILSMIGREFRIHLLIHSALAQGMRTPSDIAKSTGLSPFPVQKTLPLTKQFSPQSVRTILGRLLDIDQRIKEGETRTTTSDTSELELQVERFLVQSCA